MIMIFHDNSTIDNLNGIQLDSSMFLNASAALVQINFDVLRVHNITSDAQNTDAIQNDSSNSTLSINEDGLELNFPYLATVNVTSNETFRFLNAFNEDANLFDRPDVQALLIILYVIVFITGFVGNLIVLVVMWLHPRMRSTTNFFLTNLAVADFCVTIFCVLQNLSLYLAQSWIFGDFLCKWYNFMNSLSHTASVMILVVNCMERYVAIMRPFKARTILRHRNLLIVLLLVWISSAIYCSPRLLYFRAGPHPHPYRQHDEVLCIADRKLFNSKTFDTVSFILLYLIPLFIITVLYLRIARFLWINGVQINHQIRRHFAEIPTISGCNDDFADPSSATKRRLHRQRSSRVSINGDECSATTFGGECQKVPNLRRNFSYRSASFKRRTREATKEQYHTNENIRKWRKVVKLLVAVVACFALCNLPYHVRKMLTYYYSGYDFTTTEALMATPLTQVLTYLNSALNPILYSFMSHNFRFCVKEILSCQYTLRGKRRPIKKNGKGHLSSSHHLRLDSIKCHSHVHDGCSGDRREVDNFVARRF